MWPHRNCWLSIGIGEKQNWGKGFGREAVELILNYAFHELNLHRIGLRIPADDTPAWEAAERVGATREIVFRGQIDRDGRAEDLYAYGMLRSEYSDAIPDTEEAHHGV